MSTTSSSEFVSLTDPLAVTPLVSSRAPTELSAGNEIVAPGTGLIDDALWT